MVWLIIMEHLTCFAKWLGGTVSAVSFTLLLILAVGFVSICPLAHAAWRLVWDPNQEANLAGYKIHFGQTSGNYVQTMDVLNVTEWLIPESQPDGYFAATAYDTEGNESEYSDEVLFTRDLLPPSAATGLVVQWVEIPKPAESIGWSLGESVIIHNPTPGIDPSWSLGESHILDQRGP